MNKKEIILKEIKRNAGAFSEPVNNYVLDDIPNKKLRNAKEVHGIDVRKDILWLYDATFWGSAKESTIIVENGISIVDSDFELFLEWEKLIRVEYIKEAEQLNFIFDEDDQDYNYEIPILYFGLSLKEYHKYVETYIYSFNSIASEIIDKQKKLENEIDQELENENYQKVIDLSEQYVNKYGDSFGISMSRYNAFTELENHDNALSEANYMIEQCKELFPNPADDETEIYATAYMCKGTSLSDLEKKIESLHYFELAKENYTTNQDKKLAEDLLNGNYEIIKNNFEEYSEQKRKIIHIDNKFTDLSSERFVTLLKGNLPDLIFPVGHPVSNTLYIKHPHKDNVYKPLENYELDLFQDRVGEFCYLMQCLGAKKISIEHIKGIKTEDIENKELDINGGVSVGGAFELNAGYNKNENSSKNESSNFHLALNQSFSPTKAPYLPDDLSWFNYETKWQNIHRQRMNGNILEFSEIIKSENNKILSNNELTNIQADFKRLLFKANINVGINKENQHTQSTATEWKINVEFAPLSELTEPETLAITENVNQFSDSELEFIEELKDALEDNIITKEEREHLEQERKEFNISIERASELEEMIKAQKSGSNSEQKYYSKFKLFYKNKVISEDERRILNKLQKKLNLSDEIVSKIEKQITSEKKKNIFSRLFKKK